MGAETFVFLAYVLMLSILLGFELISKVPSILHTPLMSAANAVCGISVVGAVIIAGSSHGLLATVLGFFATVFAMINVVGGYAVTGRMLAMFRKDERKKE